MNFLVAPNQLNCIISRIAYNICIIWVWAIWKARLWAFEQLDACSIFFPFWQFRKYPQDTGFFGKDHKKRRKGWTLSRKIWRSENVSSGIWRPKFKELSFLFDLPEYYFTDLPEREHVANSVIQGAGISLALEGAQGYVHTQQWVENQGLRLACGIRKISKFRAGKSGRIRKGWKVIAGNELSPEKSDQTGVTG